MDGVVSGIYKESGERADALRRNSVGARPRSTQLSDRAESRELLTLFPAPVPQERRRERKRREP